MSLSLANYTVELLCDICLYFYIRAYISLQIGPAVVQSFHDFIIRLQMRCTGDAENHLIELLLRLVENLSAERCYFMHVD